MGLKPAVTLTQHLHRNIVRARKGMANGLLPHLEIRRQSPLPFTGFNTTLEAWLAYVDDLRVLQIVPLLNLENIEGEAPQLLLEALDRYEEAGAD